MEITSTSREDGARTVLTFEKGTDLEIAAASVRAVVPWTTLPKDAQPTVIRASSSAVHLLVTTDGSPRDTRRYTDELVGRSHMVPGVRWTHLCGGGEPVVRAVLDLPRLAAYGIMVEDVRAAIEPTLRGKRDLDAIRRAQLPKGVRVEDLAVVEEGFVPDPCKLQSEPPGGILVEIGLDGASRAETLRRLEDATRGAPGVSWLSFVDGRERRLIVYNPTRWSCVTQALGSTKRPWAAILGGASSPGMGQWDDATILLYDQGLRAEHAPGFTACMDAGTVLEKPPSVRELRVLGEDLPAAVIDEVVQALRQAKIPVHARDVPGPPTESVRVDAARAAALGVSGADVAEALRMGLSGVPVGSILDAGDQPAVVLATKASRIDQVQILTRRHGIVPLGQVATITAEPGVAVVRRANRRPYRSLAATGDLARIRDALAKVKLPPGIFVEVR